MRSTRRRLVGPIGLGVGVGIGCGVLLVAIVGAVYGFVYGSGANLQYPPGLSSAAFGAVMGAVYLGPIAALVGGLAGAMYGLGLRSGARNAGDGRRGLDDPPR